MSRGFFVLFGAPGSGKSTAAGQTFQDSLYISSAPNNLHYYKTWLKTQTQSPSAPVPAPVFADLDLAARLAAEVATTPTPTPTIHYGLPKQELVLDQYALIMDGVVQKVTLDNAKRPVPICQKTAIEHYVDLALDKTSNALNDGRPPPWRHIVFDELGTFWNRVFQEIIPLARTRDGKQNTLAAHGMMADWSMSITSKLRQLLAWDVGVVMITHDQEPDKGAERKGGPKMTSQAVMRQLCAEADGVLYRTIEDPVADMDHPEKATGLQRVWRAHSSQHWLCKLRGMSDEELEAIRTWPLDAIITRAGFTL